MKIKTLVILLIVLGILAAAGALIIHLQSSSTPSGEMGTYLLKQLPANEVASITIETPEHTVSLMKKGDLWVVEELFGYPADFPKISGLVRTLKQVKVGRKFESSEKVLKRLSLKSPGDTETPKDERGAWIRMKDKEGKPVMGILLGKTRIKGKEKKMPDGQYVMLSKGPAIYLIDTILTSFETDPSAWLEKSPVKVDTKEIQSISCMGPGGKLVRYKFERAGKDKDFELIDPSTKQKIKKSSLNRLSKALSSLQIKDVGNPSAPPQSVQKETSPLLKYHLFNGLTYNVYPGKTCSGTTPCYLRIDVDYQKPSPMKGEKTQPASSSKKAPTAEKSQEEIE
jgi:flagellar basal body-associated protein FliL